ncbi:MAG TPA: carboxypeptidase-like regulatory domain-containing protein, partial [Pyrinomonadaceae bacterium]
MSRRASLVLASALSLIWLLALARPASAQEFRGSITGRVSDATGASVAGAQVAAVNAATKIATSTSTSEDGSYTLLYLTPGQYELIIEAKGFKKLRRAGIEVRVGDKLDVDLLL